MKALSIRQPWAYLILAGLKPVENRTWSSNYRGRFLIHSGKQVDKAGYDRLRDEGVVMPALEDMRTGGIVGAATLSNIVKEHDSTFFDGPFGFVLEDVETLEFQELPGKLGFFEVPNEYYKRVGS